MEPSLIEFSKLAAEILFLGGAVWKVASMYGELKQEISKNQQDINAAYNSIRAQQDQDFKMIQMQISHISEHLNEKLDYHPPTLQR